MRTAKAIQLSGLYTVQINCCELHAVLICIKNAWELPVVRYLIIERNEIQQFVVFNCQMSGFIINCKK
jgi:hypothetical protein